MAHQPHNIPWSLLVSNLRWVSPTSCRGGEDLHPRMNPTQGQEFTDFAEAFARNIEEHSACERKKYPDKYDPPEPTDEILDEATVKKISRNIHELEDYPTIPDEERKAAAFLRKFIYSDDCMEFEKANQKGYVNLEVVMALLLYGEMDTILRACAHPDVGLRYWWYLPVCSCIPDFTDGWDQLCKTTLAAYICLNAFYCFPETWDEAHGKTKETDYRNSKSYQYMLRSCTKRQACHFMTYPHRPFFGISDDQFPDFKNEYAYGKMPIQEFLAMENESVGYQPHPSDIPLVRQILCRQGLPLELAMEIMEFAEYEPKRRLLTPHDPFHPSNREELEQYLEYCWQILVRCDVIAKAVDLEIPYADLVSNCMVELWSTQQCGYDKWWKLSRRYVYGDTPYEFI